MRAARKHGGSAVFVRARLVCWTGRGKRRVARDQEEMQAAEAAVSHAPVCILALRCARAFCASESSCLGPPTHRPNTYFASSMSQSLRPNKGQTLSCGGLLLVGPSAHTLELGHYVPFLQKLVRSKRHAAALGWLSGAQKTRGGAGPAKAAAPAGALSMAGEEG